MEKVKIDLKYWSGMGVDYGKMFDEIDATMLEVYPENEDDVFSPSLDECIPEVVKDAQIICDAELTNDQKKALTFFSQVGLYTEAFAVPESKVVFDFGFEVLIDMMDILYFCQEKVVGLDVPNFDLETITAAQLENLAIMSGGDKRVLSGTGETVIHGMAIYPSGERNVIIRVKTTVSTYYLRVWNTRVERVFAQDVGWCVGHVQMSHRHMDLAGVTRVQLVEEISAARDLIVSIDGLWYRMYMHPAYVAQVMERDNRRILVARKGEEVGEANDKMTSGDCYRIFVTRQKYQQVYGKVDTKEIIRGVQRLAAFPRPEFRDSGVVVRQVPILQDIDENCVIGTSSRRAYFRLMQLEKQGNTTEAFDRYCLINKVWFRRERCHKNVGSAFCSEVVALGGTFLSLQAHIPQMFLECRPRNLEEVRFFVILKDRHVHRFKRYMEMLTGRKIDWEVQIQKDCDCAAPPFCPRYMALRYLIVVDRRLHQQIIYSYHRQLKIVSWVYEEIERD